MKATVTQIRNMHAWERYYTDILTERLDFKAKMVLTEECTWTDKENRLHASCYYDVYYDGYGNEITIHF